MVFSSVTFAFLFLPLVLAIYHLIFLPVTLGWRPRLFRRMANLFLLFTSLAFYFAGEQFLVWIVITSTLIDYICGLIISGGIFGKKIEKLPVEGKRTRLQKLGLIGSICSNLAFLGFFKYFNFGIANYNRIVGILGLDSLLWHDVMYIALPLGISFYTFQSMSYTIDVYKGHVKATKNIIDFACYVTMFPQLVAGPIVRYRDVAQQLVTRVISRAEFASGVNRFMIGFAKKILVANTVSVPADAIFALPLHELTTGLAWLGVLSYTVQIYFDFSGYSDMAIGLGRMFGFEFLENFKHPYISRSIKEFWRRWHVSLSFWFRDYLYISLGGSKRGTGWTYINLVTVFFLCGLWHGASWTFVIWGFYHGAFLVVERLGLLTLLGKCNRSVQHIYTMIVVMGGWVLFRSETFPQSMAFFKAMAGFGASGPNTLKLAHHLTNQVQLALIAGAVFSIPIAPWFTRKLGEFVQANRDGSGHTVELAFQFARVVGIAIIAILSTLYLASGTYNPFIYFRF
ncbi:MBOAT family protein [bacterium]|nr:MBOAT family protein [bacterium]